MKLKVWFAETRPQFLLLSVVLAFLGVADGALAISILPPFRKPVSRRRSA
ncbi:unnamed protein product [marine sediment metagenome]|uniref:Uncharacterized protein n=1 Tax=marine sediment metagenome TaxID=412755 RepID=X1P0N1_9ZZZZ